MVMHVSSMGGGGSMEEFRVLMAKGKKLFVKRLVLVGSDL